MKRSRLPSLSYKLYSTFVISFIIPILIICIFISYLFSTYQYRGIQDQAMNNTKLISAYLYKYIRDIDNIMNAPFYSSYFQSKSSPRELSAYEKNEIIAEIEQTLRLTTYTRDDFGDLLFLSEQEVLYFNSENYYQYIPSVSPLTIRSWYTAALEKDGKVAIVPYDENPSGSEEIDTVSFYISRKLKNLYKMNQENVIMVHMKNNTLSSLFSELSTNTPSIILFTNDSGELIYSSSSVNQNLMNQLSQDKIDYNHSTWVHYSETLEKYPLNVHVLLSTNYISRQISAFVLVSMICYVIGIFIAYLLFHGNNKWIKIPVLHLQSVLKEIETGDLNARCTNLPVQEFDGIGISINGMAHQLQEKIKNEYELLIAQKNLQFQALQSQIQPHFIINTIYSFITLNQIGEKDLLNDAFYSFAHLLRYVLSKDNNTTIGKELDFLNHYCMLHRLRFGHRITYNICCEEKLKGIQLPKLLMQPLVENAVIHGIEPSETPCSLNIHVEKHQNTIYIIIEDDGVGFTKEQVNSTTSIGIKNVETRMNIWDENVQLCMYRIDNRSIQVIIIPQDSEGENKNEHFSN